MQTFLIVIVAAICTVKGNVLKYKPHEELSKRPDFCHDLDCPSYTVKESTKDYELRYYDATQWVSTRLKGVDYMKAQYTNFMKLFDYIQGKNDKKEKIAMTAPVLVKVHPGPGPACENDFTMSFFLSAKEENPPEPLDETVYIDKNTTMAVYVRSFPGYVRSVDKYLEEARELAEALAGKSYIKSYYFTAGYDNPFRLIDRHNEIWFLAE